MAEPVDIDPIDRDEIGEEDDEIGEEDDGIEVEDDKWGNDLMNDLERRFNKLKRFNERLETSSDTDIMLEKRKVEENDRTGCKSNI